MANTILPKNKFSKILSGLLFLLLILFPFGQLTSLSFLFKIPGLKFYLGDLVVFSLVSVWLLSSKKTFSTKRFRFLPFLLAFFLVTLLSLLTAFPNLYLPDFLISSLYWVRLVFYWSLYPVLSDLLHQKIITPKKLAQSLLLAIFFLALFGFYQLLFFPNQFDFQVFGWDPHFYRLTSTFLDPGFTALTFVCGQILALYLLFSSSSPKKPLLLVFFTLFLALLLTHSRSGYLIFTLFIPLLLLIKKKLFWALSVFALFIASLLFLPQPAGEGGRLSRIYTISARLTNYSQAFSLFKEKPVLGFGFNTLRYVKKDQGLTGYDWSENHGAAGFDSSLLFILTTSGLLGLAAFLFFYCQPFFAFFKDRKKVFLISLLGAVLVHSFTGNSLFYPWIIILLAATFALLENT